VARRSGGRGGEDGLHALGHAIARSDTSQAAPNQAGLEALGQRVAEAEKGPAQRRRRSGKARWTKTRKIVTAGVALLTLAAGVAVGGYVYVHYEFDRVPKAPCHVCVHVAVGKPYNLLVVGSDTRVGEGGQFGTSTEVGGQRSDTIKIFHIDPSAGTVRVLSIPRDTYVTTSGLDPSTGLDGAEKINAAFNNGPEALIETIRNTFGIPISHWIVINFDGVIDSVKALGGIQLSFRYPVRDHKVEPDGVAVNESQLQITQTGCQTLDGPQVLALSRSRYYEYERDGEWQMDPGSDLSRIERQNVIIEAMIAKAKSTYNPLTLHSLISSVKGDVVIDNKLTLGMIYDLVARYHAFSPSSLQTWSLPTLPQPDTPAGDVELADTDPSDDYVATIAQFLGGPPGPVTTPPLDRYGEPVAVPSTLPPATTASSPAGGGPGSQPTTTPSSIPAPPPPTPLPAYDPTLC
jgi:LCP family protein required for cell wall assembly